MADRLVIRYYPVDGEFSDASAQSGSFGVSLWVQPQASSYDASSPTMGVLAGMVGGSRVGNELFSGFGGVHASDTTLDVSSLSEGQYAESDVLLLETDSVTVRTITRSDLPLDVIVVGIGPTDVADIPDNDTPWAADELSGGSYAGGVVQIGLYEDSGYIPLSTFWVSGLFFTPKFDGTSWANPELPTQSGTLFVEPSDAYRVVRATLSTSEPTPAFWTSRIRTQEVI